MANAFPSNDSTSKRPAARSSTRSAVVVLLDPDCIDVPETPNRLPESFDSEEFEKLRMNITASGGNLEPIKVRKIQDNPLRYRLIFGERRLRACKIARCKVLAMIAAPETEARDCLDHLRENLGREDLSPYEFGVQVRNAMEIMKPITRTALAAELGVSLALVSRALDLSALPALMVSAFTSPNQIRYQDVKPLKDAWAKDSDAVGLVVADLKERGERADGPEVVKMLLEAVKAERLAPCKPTPLVCRNEEVGCWSIDSKGGLDMHLDLRMSDAQCEYVMEQVASILDGDVLRKLKGDAATEAAISGTANAKG